eukprot:55149-Chlamydomonas_euryale.AAC.7
MLLPARLAILRSEVGGSCTPAAGRAGGGPAACTSACRGCTRMTRVGSCLFGDAVYGGMRTRCNGCRVSAPTGGQYGNLSRAS